MALILAGQTLAVLLLLCVIILLLLERNRLTMTVADLTSAVAQSATLTGALTAETASAKTRSDAAVAGDVPVDDLVSTINTNNANVAAAIEVVKTIAPAPPLV